MFDHVIGLRPEEAARWVTLVERSRPILAKDGMEAVQTFLAERGVAIVQAIALTRALLGPAQTPLRVAIDIVTTYGSAVSPHLRALAAYGSLHARPRPRREPGGPIRCHQPCLAWVARRGQDGMYAARSRAPEDVCVGACRRLYRPSRSASSRALTPYVSRIRTPSGPTSKTPQSV